MPNEYHGRARRKGIENGEWAILYGTYNMSHIEPVGRKRNQETTKVSEELSF